MTKVIPILDANTPDFVEKLTEAMGVQPGDTLVIRGPQFERTDGLVVPQPDLPFSEMHLLPESTLKNIGCAKWDEPDKDGNVLWLFPHEWYSRIPAGLPIVDINGEHELFEPGKTDDDMRYGMLAFGFLRKA